MRGDSVEGSVEQRDVLAVEGRGLGQLPAAVAESVGYRLQLDAALAGYLGVEDAAEGGSDVARWVLAGAADEDMGVLDVLRAVHGERGRADGPRVFGSHDVVLDTGRVHVPAEMGPQVALRERTEGGIAPPGFLWRTLTGSRSR